MAYTPTVYTNDASSPDLDATNLNKSEQGIKLAHDIAVPVDCTSRVAEYTGDGIPLIPDNAAGTTYRSVDLWASGVDGWSAINGYGSVSIVGGKLRSTGYAGGESRITKSIVHTGKMIALIIQSDSPVSYVQYYNGSAYVTIQQNVLGLFCISTGYMTSSTGTISIKVVTVSESTYVDFDTIYIGTGAYNTPALDRAGNGNSLALTAVTPVNGKYSKEMSFNGSTSFAQASSPVIGTTGTIAVRFKRNGGLGSLQVISANRASGAVNGYDLQLNPSNQLVFLLGGTTAQSFIIATVAETTTYHTVEIIFSASTCIIYYDGAIQQTTPITITNIAGTENLTIGRYAHASANFLNGTISHFRYDSRIWTADEARAWSLNPISIDSRV